jgi:hypothetical protein
VGGGPGTPFDFGMNDGSVLYLDLGKASHG